VLHVASGDLWAGAETMLWYLAREQAAASAMPPTAVLFNDGTLAERLREARVRVFVVPEQRHGPAGLLRAVASIVRRERPDVVHTHRKKENVLGALAARLFGIPSVRTVHGIEEHPAQGWQLKRRAADRLDRLVATRLQARTVAVSRALARDLRAAGVTNAAVVHNGIDADVVAAAACVRTGNVDRDDSRIAIGFLGRLVPIKRVDRFLDVAKILVERSPGRFRFRIAGDGPLLAWTRERVAELGLADSVETPGHVVDTRAFMRDLDALFITSDSEGIPYAVLECLALGVPVVGPAVGGLPEVLDEGRAGVLVAPGAAEGFVEQGLRLADDRAALHRYAARGRELVRARFAAAEMGRGYARVYSEACGYIKTNQTSNDWNS
jgi:glycosyltransferase involved in cell wall biosynthesis